MVGSRKILICGNKKGEAVTDLFILGPNDPDLRPRAVAWEPRKNGKSLGLYLDHEEAHTRLFSEPHKPADRLEIVPVFKGGSRAD